jgi:hypothetical protein
MGSEHPNYEFQERFLTLPIHPRAKTLGFLGTYFYNLGYRGKANSISYLAPKIRGGQWTTPR